jgi:enterochelin esterase-like enzyme
MPTRSLHAKIKKSGNPIIENEVATFIWEGKNPPRVIDDTHNWDDSPQKMLNAGRNLWYFPIPLPTDAYLEYAFLDPKTGERIPDPLNPRRVWNGINAFNHYFYMPQGMSSPLVHGKKGIAHGAVTKYSIPTREYVTGRMRTVYLYHPPVKEPVPLLIVLDGSEYLHRGKLNTITDNLIAGKRIRPIAMALIKNGGPSRTVEYSCGESTTGFLMECVLPLAREHLTLEPEEHGNYGILGASLGGSMALFTSLRLPGVFRKVLSQSGAFMAPDYQAVVVDLVRYAPRPDIKIWMDVGRLEWLLKGNQEMYALLEKKNYHVKYREFPGGHNYTSWRNDIGFGLEAMYGK